MTNQSSGDQKRIEELEKEISRLRRLVYYDELTGLYNRRGFLEVTKNFLEALKSEFSGTKKRRLKIGNLAVVFADLNRLKQVNDRYGHRYGDEMIVSFGKFLAKNVRGVDVVGRWSGDEFVVALVGAGKTEAELVVQKIKDDLAKERFRVGRGGGVLFRRVLVSVLSMKKKESRS